jgi:hypothetical protein
MPVTFAALGVMLLLLPGFLTAYIVQALCVRRKQSDLDKVIEALIFSLVSYVISASLIGAGLPLTWQVQAGPGGSTYYRVANIEPGKLSILLIVPILLGLVIALAINNDLLRFLRRIRGRGFHLTDRTTRSSIWNDVLKDIVGVAQIELSDGRSVIGWVKYYSDDPEDASVFLERAAWVNTDTDALDEIPGAGILVTKAADIRTVMFLDASERVSIDARIPPR